MGIAMASFKVSATAQYSDLEILSAAAIFVGHDQRGLARLSYH
jgi:hypothetical protein